MITTRNRAEQVLGMMCSGKKKEKTLWYCSYELAVFRRHYLQCGQFTPIGEEADFCLLVTKPFQQGGVFYDVELPEGRHGLFQAMNEKELMFEIARLMECNILEREDTAVAVRRTDIMRVVSSLLTYSGKDGEWKATLYANAAYAGKKALCMCTISDNIKTGEALSAEDRQLCMTNMMDVAFNMI